MKLVVSRKKRSTQTSAEKVYKISDGDFSLPNMIIEARRYLSEAHETFKMSMAEAILLRDLVKEEMNLFKRNPSSIWERIDGNHKMIYAKSSPSINAARQWLAHYGIDDAVRDLCGANRKKQQFVNRYLFKKRAGSHHEVDIFDY